MWLSDTSVKRPVFATVISLLLLAFGALAYQTLPTREYPDITPARVSVTAQYPGANAAVVETKVTQVLEDAVSGIEGIKSIRSTSRDGRAQIDIEFNLDRDIDEAANDVRDKTSRVTRRLPEDIEDVTVAKAESDAMAIIYFSVASETMSKMDVADYVDRYILDRLAVIPGVSEVSMFGGGRPAMRINLDRQALAAQSLTVTDVISALRTENLELPAGLIESDQREFPVRISRNYQSEEDFRNLVLLRGEDGHLVRLGEVADVEMGPQTLRRNALNNGSYQSTAFAVYKQSTANTVTVLQGIYEEADRIRTSLPDGMVMSASGDASAYIRAALNSVYTTIAITIGLVALVIYFFLCTFRATFIPMVTVPVCLVASFIALAFFGFSINLITLLALVLAIGLVVDDSIVVLENISRRMQKGEAPLLAAYKGARQVSFAVIATTLVIVAVFVPIAFLEDNIGQIFSELAITISAAVIFSSILALSLAPAMSSKLLRHKSRETGLASWVDQRFEKLSAGYEAVLKRILGYNWFAPVVLLLIVSAGYFLFRETPQEYAPQQEQDTVLASIRAAEGTSVSSMSDVLLRVHAPVDELVENGTLQRTVMMSPFRGGQSNQGFGVFTMAPWGERDMTATDLRNYLMRSWSSITDAQIFAFTRNGLSRGGGNTPVQFVLQSSDYAELAQWRDQLTNAARNSGLFGRLDSDLKETQQQLLVQIDKNRAADLGVSAQSIGDTLQAMMSEQTVSTFVKEGEEYDVVMQAKSEQRQSPEDMRNLYVRSSRSGELIPLSNLIEVDNIADTGVLNRYNRLRSVTISGDLAEGVTLGEALGFLEDYVDENMPDYALYDYQGESLEFKESSGGIYFTFGIALLVLFLVMAAQFESFVHPFIIMLTVPTAITGALLGLYVTGNTLNIFSQIGMLMIIGIATKNGILIVEFINQMRDAGHEFHKSIVEAAKIRLRPVIMTTMSTVMGSIPLMLARGPGSESLIILGIVVFSGVLFSAVLTLLIVPAFYNLMARGTRSPEEISRELEALQQT